MREAVEARAAYRTDREAAESIGIGRETFRSRLAKAAECGIIAEIGLDKPLGEGFGLKGYSLYTKTQAGEPIWLKTRAAEKDYWEGVTAAIEGLSPIDPNILPAPEEPQSDIIPWLQIGDAHIGMLASEAETGANFDVAIAKREICAAAAALIDEAPECERMVINDLAATFAVFAGAQDKAHHLL